MALRVLLAVVAAMVLVLPWLRLLTGWAIWDAVDAVLGLQCHRLEGRVIVIGNVSMAVCSRCAGVYAGIVFGAASAWPRWKPRTTVWVVIVAGTLMVAEVVLERAGSLPVVHVLRLLTGVMLSWPVSALAVRWVARKR